MAEIADICLALANVIQGVVFPNGLGGACAIPGLTGACAIYQNWPTPNDIDNRLVNGNDVLIATIDTGVAKSTKRYPAVPQVVSQSAITLNWTVSGTTATLTGAVATPQNLAIEPGNGSAYAYGVQAGDTLNSIAANMAALIPGASAVGPTVTIPGATKLVARVGSISTTVKEVGRQRSLFQVVVFAPTDALRAATVSLIKPVLDDLRRLSPLPDGTGAWIGCGAEVRTYDPLKLGLSQSNITYPIEFASTVTATAAQAIAWKIAVQGSALSPNSATDPTPINITV